MKQIKLTKGKVTFVDDEDYELLSKYRWYFNRYAYTSIKKYSVGMHRIILKLHKGDKIQTDHINHNPLDNRRFNLRVATQSQNNANRRGYKGVHWSKTNKKWRAMIQVDGIKKHIGLYSSVKKALLAYRNEKKKLFGKFACVR